MKLTGSIIAAALLIQITAGSAQDGQPADSLQTGYEEWFTLEELAVLESYEDSINELSDAMFNDPDQAVRQRACHDIIRTLKSALLLPNSFRYGFPNIESISMIQPEDDAFRIYTWQFAYNNNTYRYYGAIQMNSPELELHPLVDHSALLEDMENLVTDNNQWVGALYYGVVKVNDNGRDLYTLFGYDGNNAFSTRKIADVLWFTDEGEIRFGAPVFYTGAGKPLSRFIIEFKKGAAAGINYSEQYGKIMFDNLIPIDEKSEGMYFNYVPDGSYKGFEWRGNKWVFIDKLFDYKLEDGEFPDESYGDRPSVQEKP